MRREIGAVLTSRPLLTSTRCSLIAFLCILFGLRGLKMCACCLRQVVGRVEVNVVAEVPCLRRGETCLCCALYLMDGRFSLKGR